MQRLLSLHPLQTDGDDSSRAHLSSMSSGQCELRWRQNLRCMPLRWKHALQTSRFVHS